MLSSPSLCLERARIDRIEMALITKIRADSAGQAAYVRCWELECILRNFVKELNLMGFETTSLSDMLIGEKSLESA